MDFSVYPDLEQPPASLETDAERADYIHRICGAWDFGVIPTDDTFALFSTWRSQFDAFPIPNSPSYHAFRMYFGWPDEPGFTLEARYEILDRREQRGDPCSGMI